MRCLKGFRHLALILLFLRTGSLIAQTAWPSESWTTAVNITSIMSSGGITEVGALFWNPVTNRLYVQNSNGNLRILQMNTSTNSLSQIGNVTFSGGAEGITQANLNANEFYTVDERNYQIRKYTHTANYSSVTLSKSWNITASPSLMPNTANAGPEGITFVPDSFLSAVGFVRQSTGLPYTSVKGMGGLMFVANQTGGYIWVFDVNPNSNNDFAYVGKYKTNKTESCDLAFERSTGLLYILHNTGGNTLEVTNLTTTLTSSNNIKFVTTNEYTIPNPSGNINIEGFAITQKCTDSTNVSVWLSRDVEATESTTYQKDCVRWFNPFNAPGTCVNPIAVNLNLKVFIEGLYSGNGLMKPSINNSLYPTLCDTLTVELHQPTGQHALAYKVKGTINTNGIGNFIFPGIIPGSRYYIVVRHRNGLETWSASSVLLNNTSISYSFTDAITKAYGNKLVNLGNGYFGIFSGDVDQNGIINSNDITNIKSKLQTFSMGYLSTDLNGDKIVESSDFSMAENNSLLLISTAHP